MRYALQSQGISPSCGIDPGTPIADLDAERTREKCPQPQQPDLMQHESWIGRHCRQPVDLGLRILEVAVAPTAQECLHQDGGAQHTPDGPTRVEKVLEYCSR